MADGKAVGLELTVAIKQLLFLFHYLLLSTCDFWGLHVVWGVQAIPRAFWFAPDQSNSPALMHCCPFR